MLGGLYGQSLTLLTDLYQLSMAAAAWKTGIEDREAVFHLLFRRAPFGSGFTVAAGLATALEYLKEMRFSEDDLRYLAELRVDSGEPMFEAGFLEHLRGLELRLRRRRRARRHGRVPPGAARARHRARSCPQLLETPLLDLINFQTLIATKAARVCTRRAGRAGAGVRPAARAGRRRRAERGPRRLHRRVRRDLRTCWPGKLLGIPVRGTHAHSWVMLFDSEREAFDAYAARHAPQRACCWSTPTIRCTACATRSRPASGCARRAASCPGIRLDSGDLAWLSIEARKLLDEAGFPEDRDLRQQRARRERDRRASSSRERRSAPGAWARGW